VKHFALMLACALCLDGAAALAQPAAASGQDPPRFDIRVEAPEEARLLLEKHLQLQRFRAVSDLDAGELERLLVMAREDALQLLGTLGYFSPDIDIRQDVAEPGQRPVIVLRVATGPVTVVGGAQLQFEGDIVQTSDADALALRAAIERDWRLRPGRRFTQDAWDGAKTQALAQLVARRYPAGRISLSAAEIDTERHSARLDLRLDSGPLYRLGELQVSGLQRYDPALVPRLGRLRPGDVYDQRRLVEAQQRLAGSGYFDAAAISLDTEGDPAAAPVLVQLREAALQKVALGLGFASDSGPRLSLEHVHNRVPGLDWRARSRLQLDGKSPSAQTEWTSLPDPALWRWFGSLRLDRLNDASLRTDTQRWRVGRSQAGERIDRNVYLQYDRSEVSGVARAGASASDAGEGAALSLNYAWSRRAFDTLPFPQRGHALTAEFGGGSTLGGQRHPYVRGAARWNAVVPLDAQEQLGQARRSRLALRLEAGAVGAARQAQIPAAQLFRTGGDTTVRGYGLRDIGLPLPNGSVGPGRYMAAGSVEWQQPLRQGGVLTSWESTLFVDAGEVAERAAGLGRNPAVGVGTGLRWRSPIGPLQIDLAYGLQTQQLRLHLNVGWVF
jgi:translocation and assembly module TamA